MTALDEQPVPSGIQCPECGDSMDDVLEPQHRLSQLGYLADDVTLNCACGASWLHGIPVGEGGEDMTCPVCSEAAMRVHQIDDAGPYWNLHFKCPSCYHWRKEKRVPDDDGFLLVGDSDLTGAQEAATDRGYQNQ